MDDLPESPINYLPGLPILRVLRACAVQLVAPSHVSEIYATQGLPARKGGVKEEPRKKKRRECQYGAIMRCSRSVE